MKRLKPSHFSMAAILILFFVSVIAGITCLLPYSNEQYFIALTAISTLFLAGGTVWFMQKQTSDARRVAGLQMFLQLDKQYNEDTLRAAREILAPVLIARQGVLSQQAEEILDFFEMLAFYTRKGHLDIDLVSTAFSVAVRCYWHVLKAHALDLRAADGDGLTYEHIEWLEQEFTREFAEKKRITLSQAIPTEEQIDRFLRSETTRLIPLIEQAVCE